MFVVFSAKRGVNMKVQRGRNEDSILRSFRRISSKDSVFTASNQWGVRPIVYKDHKAIPNLLGKVYISGLFADNGSDQVSLPLVQKITHGKLARAVTTLTDNEYWSALLECRNGGLPASYK
jgi:hypothetical protein